jgi:hypothetical protein
VSAPAMPFRNREASKAPPATPSTGLTSGANNEVDNPKTETAPPLGPVVNDSDIVDWNGPDDPQNPRNWANGVRLTHVLLVSAFTLYS